MEYVTLSKTEGAGSNGAFGIEIKVAASKLPDLKQRPIWIAANSAEKLIEKALCGAIKADNPDTIVQTENNRKLVDDVFSDAIFVEEIGNGYCNDWCCEHLPWFIATTKVGRFAIGWRKRVVSIDWNETVGTKTSDELFKEEDVTKEHKLIHAWGVENAKLYVKKIIDSVD